MLCVFGEVFRFLVLCGGGCWGGGWLVVWVVVGGGECGEDGVLIVKL